MFEALQLENVFFFSYNNYYMLGKYYNPVKYQINELHVKIILWINEW